MTLALGVLVAGAAAGSCTPARTSSDGTCPPGASLGAGGCACREDLRLVLGACLSARAAAAQCEPLATATRSGCAPLPPCEPGRARDVLSGACLPRREVRALATSLGILVADDEIVGCPAGTELAAVAAGSAAQVPRLGCLDEAVAFPTPAIACPAGSLAVAGRRCARVSDGARVDVVRWLHAAIGAEGGQGTPLLCAALARSPGALGAPGRDVHVTVNLAFPNNDVSLVAADVHGVSMELERTLAPMIVALRGLGGTASHPSAGTTVFCAAAKSPAVVAPTPAPENAHEK